MLQTPSSIMLIVKATSSTSLYIARGDGEWRKKTEGLLPHTVQTRQSWAHASQALCDNNKHLEHKVPLLSRQVVPSAKSNKENNLLEARVCNITAHYKNTRTCLPLWTLHCRQGIKSLCLFPSSVDKIPLSLLQFSSARSDASAQSIWTSFSV